MDVINFYSAFLNMAPKEPFGSEDCYKLHISSN